MSEFERSAPPFPSTSFFTCKLHNTHSIQLFILVRIRNGNADPGGQKCPQKIEKSGEVLQWGLGINTAIFNKKIEIKFFSSKVFRIIGHQTLGLDPDPHWSKILDPNPHQNQCGSKTLLGTFYRSGPRADIMKTMGLLSGSTNRSVSSFSILGLNTFNFLEKMIV
jgi:hypothetical protein